jgi:hypothetical protein
MKAALCFIISYEHILNKEEIWKEWIEPNKDIINVYFYYKDLKKIKSSWIRKHTIPSNYIFDTSYYHVIPAYISIMKYALSDVNNSWFCMLTDSCCPIISPNKFRYLFYNYYNKSIMRWKTPWWNIDLHKRANLAKFPPELRLANEPWFILKRENVMHILNFVNKQQQATKLICDGGLANESIFAMILHGYKQLEPNGSVISEVTHIADWNRMASATSPHLFKDANDKDILFMETEIDKNPYCMFIRKIAPEFPNNILRNYIYDKNKDKDSKLIICEPTKFIYSRVKNAIRENAHYMLILFVGWVYYYLVFTTKKT